VISLVTETDVAPHHEAATARPTGTLVDAAPTHPSRLWRLLRRIRVGRGGAMLQPALASPWPANIKYGFQEAIEMFAVSLCFKI
jgi:hypothetical protein